MMDLSRFERWAPLTGVLAVLLMLVATVLFGFYEYLPAADAVAAHATDNATRITIAGYIGLISGFEMMWFAGSLYSGLRAKEGGDGRLSMVAFGGGISSGLALAAGFAAMVASGSRAGSGGGIGLAEAVTLNDLYSNILGGIFAITLAVLISGAAGVFLKKGIFPAWFGWLSVVIAIGLITPIAYIVLALGLLWLIVVSIWLFRQGAQPS